MQSWIQIYINKKDSCLFPIKATSQVRRCASEISVMCFVNAFREMWNLKKGSHIGFVANVGFFLSIIVGVFLA